MSAKGSAIRRASPASRPAASMLASALAIDEKRLGPESPRVALDLTSLATLYRKLAEAEPG